MKPTVNTMALLFAIVSAIFAFFIGGVLLCEMEGVPNPAYLSWVEERKSVKRELHVISTKKVRKRSDGKWVSVKLPQEELKREAELLSQFNSLGKNVPSDSICPSIWKFFIIGLESSLLGFVIAFLSVRFIGRKISGLLKRYIGEIEFSSDSRSIGGSDGGSD
jgi:hypothetical protein